jgi:hypothetical protein
MSTSRSRSKDRVRPIAVVRSVWHGRTGSGWVGEMRRALWSVVLPMVASVCMCPGGAFGAPMRCDITESSAAGGVVQVLTEDSPAPGWPKEIKRALKLQLLWRPPPSPQSPQLVVGYAGATLQDMGNEPSGGHIRFRISPPATADDTRVVLGLPDGQTFLLQGDDLHYGQDYGSDDESRPVMDVAFGPRDGAWPKIRSVLMERGRLEVKLMRHGELMAETVFDFSNLKARNALLAQARRKLAASDPQVCTTAPIPVVRMF